MEAAEVRQRPERRNHKFNRRRLKTLERRADHLDERVGSEASESYDEAESQALRWAIWALRQWMAEDPYWAFDPDPKGSGGQWRELGYAYWDEYHKDWRTMPAKDAVRKATAQEIAEAKAEGEYEYVPQEQWG
jgi:hypothetical protein